MSKRECPVKKNDFIEVRAQDIGVNGEGIGRYEGYTLFVSELLVGELARVKVLKTGKNFGFAKIDEILEMSPHRCEPVCPVANQCGGCQLQHLNYEGQLLYKQNKVLEAMRRIGGLSDIVVLPTVGAEHIFHYRNKVQYPVRREAGQLKIGFYAKNSHRIIETPRCFIQDIGNEPIVAALRVFMETYDISAYHEEEHRGLIRHLVIRRSHLNQNFQVTLVATKSTIPHVDKFLEALMKLGNVIGLSVNVNPDKTNVILGRKTQVLWGEAYLEDAIGKVKFKISPQSFYQVNPEQTLKLYELSLKYAQVTSQDLVVDAYCGIGTITLFLAQQAKEVIGVEIVPQAIEDANQNKTLNDIENATFYVGEAETVIPRIFEETGLRPDVMVVDPPRKGCDQALLDTIVAMSPKRLVYVSCDPATLARDCKILTARGYEVEVIQPVDMFPMSVHVEAIVLLHRKND